MKTNTKQCLHICKKQLEEVTPLFHLDFLVFPISSVNFQRGVAIGNRDVIGVKGVMGALPIRLQDG